MKDAEQDARLTVIESDVGGMKTDIALIKAEQENASSKADDRHQEVQGTQAQTLDAIGAFRKDEEKREDKRLLAIKEDKDAARAERAALFSSPRTWALAFAALVAFTSPSSVPLMLHYGASFLNLKPPAEEAAELPKDEPAPAPTAPPAVPE